MVIAGVLCGTSLDLGDEGLEDEPARSATSRVGHSIIGLQPNEVTYAYSHIRSLVCSLIKAEATDLFLGCTRHEIQC